MKTVNIHDAKTNFSQLVDKAHAGEEIVVAKAGVPWARLVPPVDGGPRVPDRYSDEIPSSFFDELPKTELDAWEE